MNTLNIKNGYDFITQADFFKKLMKLPFVSRVILYGSRARGSNRERSDIDLAIDCPQASPADWLALSDLIEDNKDTLLNVDYVRYDELSSTNPLKQAIDKDGIELYKNESEKHE
jgi:predicted nucleotidyltransferase